MKRGLQVAGITLVSVVVGLVGLTLLLSVWVLHTESGSRFAIGQARGLLPAGIELGAASGRVGDRLVLADVVIDQPGMRLVLDRVWLDWSPGGLAGGALVVHELGARGVRYTAREPEEEPPPSEPFQLPERTSLPVSVLLESLTVEDVEAYTAPDADPVVVEQVAASGLRFVDSELTLEGLRVQARSPMVSARASLAATAAGDYPLTAELDWSAELEGYAPLEGTTRLDGSLAVLELTQRLAAPYDLELSGTVRNAVNPDAPITVDAELSVDGVRLANVSQSLPEAVLTLDAQVSGPVGALEVRATAAGTDAEQRRFQARVAALVEGQSIQLETLRVTQPERDGQIVGQGRIALAGAVEADLHVEWTSLAWPLTGEPTVRSPRGALDFTGPLDDYRLRVETRLETVDAPPVELALSGKGSLEAAQLELDARTESGSAGGRVDLAWADGLRAAAELDVRDLDPAVVAPGWPGRVNLELAGSGQMVGERIEAEVRRLQGSGTLREQPLSLAAVASYRREDGTHYAEFETLEARYGPTRVNVQGRIGEEADLRWQLASDDLSTLLDSLEGQVSGAGTVAGPVPRMVVAADLEGTGLAYDEYELAQFSFDADVDLSGEARSTMSLEVRDALVAGTAVPELSLAAEGNAASHQASLSARAEPGRAQLALEGRLDQPWGANPAWHFTLSEGEIGFPELPTWTLARSAPNVVSAQRLEVGRQCWQAAEAGLCIELRRDPQGLAGEAVLSGLRYQQLAGVLPEGLTPQGAIDAAVTVSYPRTGPVTARADVTTPQGELHADVRLDESAAAADAATAVPLQNRPITASLRLDVPDLAFVSAMTPAIEDLRGRIDGDLQIAGTLAQPSITGAVALNDGRLDVPQPGLTLTDVAMTLEGRGRESIALSASATSDDGELRLDGTLSPLGEAPTAELRLVGEEFLVVDNDDARMVLSPNLRVDASAERIDITGEVTVPEAAITPGTQPPQAVTVSGDQVLVEEEPAEDETAPREIHAEVRLVLGDEVSFEGFGLLAELDGELLVRQEPETPVTASGEIIIEEGEYRAYGQGLVIDSGRIYFAGGPITEPALDIRAVRRPEAGILVGAEVGGTLQTPTFELFSEPTMTQQQQLSWLILGRSLEQTPDGEGSALNRAILAMGLKGGDFLAQNIGEQIGLDEVGVQTGTGEAGGPSDPNQASLVVGKYLSPKVYVSYGIGLFDPESVLKLQYEISKKWQIVTESSGEGTGADVLYSVEVGN